MIYRYKMPVNKESIKVYLILAACAVVGIGSFFLLPTIGAVIVLAICGFIAYQILKAMAKALSARVTTYTDGFSVRMADGTKMEFEWDLISYAGFVVEGIQKGYLFVYEESVDRFIQLPPAFENLQELREEIEEHHPVEDCIMKPSETIKERIKSIFVPESTENEASAKTASEASGVDSAADVESEASGVDGTGEAEETINIEEKAESGATDDTEAADSTKLDNAD